MKLRVAVDPDLCIGAASCVTMDPQTFVMNEENKAEVLVRGIADGGPSFVREIEVTDEKYALVLQAAQSCPTMAIVLTNGETGEQLYP